MTRQKGNLSSFGMIPLVAVAVGFIVSAAAAVLLLQVGVNSNHRAILGERLAREIAQQVNIKDARITGQLRTLATTQLVIDAVEGSSAARLAAEATVQAMVPNAVKVSIIPRGAAKIDQGYPPFNYTALDLVNRSETGTNPSMEAISTEPQLEGEKWVINATPITSPAGDIIGTLFVYLAPGAISELLTDGQSGAVTVMQTLGTTPKPVVLVGSGSPGEVYSVDLNNPNWTVQYSPSPQLADSAPMSIVMYLIPPGLMLAIALVGVIVGAGRTGAMIRENIRKLGDQLDRATSGKYDQASYSIPEFVAIDQKIKPLKDLANTVKPASRQTAQQATRTQKKKAAEDEIVEIEMTDDVEELDLEEALAEEARPEPPAGVSINPSIFRAYDIRGIVGETLSEEIATLIGKAVGSEAAFLGETSILVGYDGREYSPALAEALISGITSTGMDVVNVGAVPTPVVYYGTHTTSSQSGVIVTGSHNPPEYNGFKIVLAGKSLVENEIRSLYERIDKKDFAVGEGAVSSADILQDYIDAIVDDVVVAQPLKVVVDCGNGIAGAVVPELLDALGCEPVPLYCEVDGSFPNHHPDPTRPENLQDLIQAVQSQEADFGIAFDGDGDRLVAVTPDGNIVWPDKLLMLFAKDVVSRNPGSDVVYDVKCTRHLNGVISGFGGRPIICRSGHSFVKEKIAETDAMLGGEFSGHICFGERWYGFDDGMYSAARLLEIVGAQEAGLADLLAEFPESIATPEIHIAVDDIGKFELIEQLRQVADFEDATVTSIDGLRIDFADGWGLVRASNTEPALTLRFEADTQQALDNIQNSFRKLLQEANKDLNF